MKFCSNCGAAVEIKIPEGDSHPRHVCPACNEIHYLNPKIVVGCIAEWHGKVLLCKRAIEPRIGYWTLPAGFMENGESTMSAAGRETLEEANASTTIKQLFAVTSVPHISQVHMFYRATLDNTDFFPGFESQETQLFAEHEIPWDDIAFTTVRLCLEDYFRDKKMGRFDLHERSIAPANSEVT